MSDAILAVVYFHLFFFAVLFVAFAMYDCTGRRRRRRQTRAASPAVQQLVAGSSAPAPAAAAAKRPAAGRPVPDYATSPGDGPALPGAAVPAG